MRAPAGVLDSAASVELRVIDADQASCLDSGFVEGSPPEPAVQTFSLAQNGCAAGAAWCKTVTLAMDGSSKVFGVLARDAAGQPVAQGCTRATIDQDPLDISIQVKRYNPPKCCGDGVLQAGEQCDTGLAAEACPGDTGGCSGIIENAVCHCDCLGREILLSIDNTAPPALTNGPAGTNSALALAFSGSAGDDRAHALRAVYVDSLQGPATPDINLRMLQADLFPFTDGPLAQQLRLPQCDSATSAAGKPRTQRTPEIAAISDDLVAVVYATDEQQGGKYDIHLSLQNEYGCADEDPFPVNDARNDSCEHPDIARGPAGVALAVWGDQGQVHGRLWTDDGSATGALDPADEDLDIAGYQQGSQPRVGGSDSGWVVAYQDQGNAFVKTVAPTNGAVGSAVKVNAAAGVEQLDVAMLSDGRYVVVWSSAGAIYFQRFDAAGTAVAGDQEHPLSVDSPAASQPVAAAASGGSSFFAVAWTAADGTIWARFVGGSSGFGFNSVTGQNDAFLVSHPAIWDGIRSEPSVALGGDGYVAIGWQDAAEAHPGIFVRRFPLPE